MKHFIVIICVLLSKSYCQEIEFGWMNSEIFFITANLDEEETIHYMAEAVSIRWSAENTIPPSNYTITSNFGIGWYPDIYDPGIGNVDPENSYSYYRDCNGFDFINAFPYYNDYILTYGIYKISIAEEGREAYFYLDYRDTRFRAYSTGMDCHQVDIFFLYDGNADKFGFHCEGPQPPTIDPEEFEEVENGSYLTIWDLKDQSPSLSPATSDFEDYWENCLVLIPTVNDNPRLVWGSYPESVDLAGYFIYRKVGSGSFSLLNFNYETELQYTDEDYTITSPTGVQLQYYVKAVYTNEQISSPTNTVTTQGVSILKDNSDKIPMSDEYSLFQNYPNPFNPTTSISFSIKQAGFVSLKVYDILGKEVVELVNEVKNAGNYSVTLNASEFPSGIYFYTLTSGNFNATKKLILLK